MMASRTLQEVNAILHRLLLIASEEVNLHSCHAHLLQPSELLLSILWSIQSLMRSRRTPCLNPSRRGIIPKQRFDTIVLGVLQSLLNGRTILHLVPFCINQNVWQFQNLRHIYIFLDDIQVVAAMIVSPVYPAYASRMNPRSIFQATRRTDIRHQGRCHQVLFLPDDDYSPRRIPSSRIMLSILVQGHMIILWILFILQGRNTIVSLYARLGNQGKHIILLQQARIPPMLLSSFSRYTHWEKVFIRFIPVLEPPASALGDMISSQVLSNGSMLQAFQLIAECHTIIIEANPHAHQSLQVISESIDDFVCLVLTLTLLSHQHPIVFRDKSRLRNALQDEISATSILSTQTIIRYFQHMTLAFGSKKHLLLAFSPSNITISYVENLHLIYYFLCLPFYPSIRRRECMQQVLGKAKKTKQQEKCRKKHSLAKMMITYYSHKNTHNYGNCCCKFFTAV